MQSHQSSIRQTILFIALGFILGCCVTDAISMRSEVKKRESSVHFGMILMAYLERPEHCPYCGYEFNYLYNLDESEIQEIINNYLDHVPYRSSDE